MSLPKTIFICQIFLLADVLCFHLIESDLKMNSFAGPQNVETFKNESYLETSTTGGHRKPIQQDAAVKDRPQNETILGDDVENQHHRQHHQYHHHLPYTTQPQYQLKYENNFQKHDANTTTKLLSSTLYQWQQLRQQQQKHGNQNVIETTTTATTTIIQNGVHQPHNLEKHQQLTVNQAIIKQKQQKQQQQQHQYQQQQLFLCDFKLLNAVNCRNKRQTQQTVYNNGNNNNNNATNNDNNNGNANVNANGNQQQKLYTTYSIQYYPYHQQQRQQHQQQQQQQQSLPYEMQRQRQHPQYQLQYYQPSSQNLQKNYNNNDNNNPQIIGNGNSLSIHPSSLPSAPAVASIYTSTLALPAINMQHKQQHQSVPQKSLLALPLPLPTFLATTTAATTLDSFQPLLPLDIINEYEQDNVNDDGNTFVCEMCCNPMELQPPNCTECCSTAPLLHVETLKTLSG